MPVSRRARACDACHALKIKCELGSAGEGQEPPCQRCLRLGKTCSVSPPVRQKDRIAELEAKLEEMTKLLRFQELQESTPDVSSRVSPRDSVSLDARGTEARTLGRSSKKRRVDSESVVDNYQEFGRSSPDQIGCKLEVDHVVPRALQKQLFCKYREEIEPVFPFPITKGYEGLREECPLLLQAVVFAASPGVLHPDVQDDLTSIVMKLLTPDEVFKAKKSVELVQAILITTFWYRPPKNQTHIAIDRFLDIAIGVAEDLGLSTLDCALSVASRDLSDQVSSSDAWRTWSLCYLLSASLGSCMRIASKIDWDADFEMKLSSLEYARDAVSTDGLLCQFVRSERLCQQITFEAGYNGSDSILEVTDHDKVRRIQNLIKDRKAQAFSSLSCPSLRLYEHIATIYLYECILHTPTNERSFAAPYVAERLSASDFPAPLVTPDHISFLYGLRDACHAVLNTVLAFDITAVASSPLIVLSAKAFYAQYLLTKLYIAVTATGNTYGAFIDAQSLAVETYLGRMADLGDAICIIDETYMAGKGLQSSKRLREWVWNYNALQAEESLTNFHPPTTAGLGLDNVAIGLVDTNIDWSPFDINSSGYGLEDLFGPFPG